MPIGAKHFKMQDTIKFEDLKDQFEFVPKLKQLQKEFGDEITTIDLFQKLMFSKFLGVYIFCIASKEDKKDLLMCFINTLSPFVKDENNKKMIDEFKNKCGDFYQGKRKAEEMIEYINELGKLSSIDMLDFVKTMLMETEPNIETAEDIAIIVSIGRIAECLIIVDHVHSDENASGKNISDLNDLITEAFSNYLKVCATVYQTYFRDDINIREKVFYLIFGHDNDQDDINPLVTNHVPPTTYQAL